MNERLQRYSDWFRGIGRPIASFAKQNRAVFLSLAAGTSILLIIWARLGFTLNISTFFAADTPSPTTLTVQCSGAQAVLSWNIPANANSNSIQKKLVSGGDWQWAMQDTGLTRTTYTDSFTASTIYRHKSGANVASNEVQCNSTTPTPTSTPIPSTLTIQCSGNQAILSWNIPAGADSNSIQKKLVSDGLWQWAMQDTGLTRTTYTDTFSAPTIYRHKSATNAASNEVQCAIPTATLTPTPTPSLTPTPTPTISLTPTPTTTGVPTIAFNITGQNITTGGSEMSSPSAFTNQDILLIARIRNVGSGIVSNTNTRISIPTGLTYVAGSTKVNGTPAITDSFAGSGLMVGSLGLSQEIMVQMQVRTNWSVIDQAILQVPVVLSVRADGINEQVVSTTVLVSRTLTPPSAVSTGPGDATLIALMVSAITALLYLSYTRSPTFRRHEIERSGGSGEPLDFRN